ncbi:MAG: hypothetical protein ACPGUD_01690 [Parashewanella sp.]
MNFKKPLLTLSVIALSSLFSLSSAQAADDNGNLLVVNSTTGSWMPEPIWVKAHRIGQNDDKENWDVTERQSIDSSPVKLDPNVYDKYIVYGYNGTGDTGMHNVRTCVTVKCDNGLLKDLTARVSVEIVGGYHLVINTNQHEG